MKKTNISRRNFLKNTSIGLSGGIVSTSLASCDQGKGTGNKKLPREARLVAIDMKGLLSEPERESRIKKILRRMEETVVLQPDVVCLPETFDTAWVSEQKPLGEIAEDEKVPGPVTSLMAEFAKKNHCYVVCPIFTKNEGLFYNSSILIDRKGNIAGVYHKIHPSKPEIIPDDLYIGGGITPGALDQPVFETDFGKVGMLICYDTNWWDGWDNLKEKGAEVVFFSSQFPGGRILNYYAWRNSCYVLSSTSLDARVIDISGNDLFSSSNDVRYAWATVNLEKANTMGWSTSKKLHDILEKYGNMVELKVWDPTLIITIESRDPKLKVSDILTEFDIKSIDEILKNAEEVQKKYRL